MLSMIISIFSVMYRISIKIFYHFIILAKSNGILFNLYVDMIVFSSKLFLIHAGYFLSIFLFFVLDNKRINSLRAKI